MIDRQRLSAAYQQARTNLLSRRIPAGHWVGKLSASPLSTATAISAMALVERRGLAVSTADDWAADAHRRKCRELIPRGLHWLTQQQNEDGGWGDTDRSYSNIATTMLVVAAFRLTEVPAEHADLLLRAERYIQRHGGVAGLRTRYGIDKTFAVPILTNCALADMVPWHRVSPLPFELASLPQKFYRFVRLPVVSYALPALVAIGQARFFHQPPVNPVLRRIRARAVDSSLRVLERMQPASGGYLEAVPITSFVVMSLASTGRVDHAVARRGVDFLLASASPDGSWPIDTNLAAWNTTLAMNALAGAGEDIAADLNCLDWLLSCQHRRVHPYTGSDPGGWAWTDLSGGVPDADDTSGALLALSHWHRSAHCSDHEAERIHDAAAHGVQWLLQLQNRDGGWPTFCRGWGKLPLDRSGTDLTAHAIRALHAWRDPFTSHRLDQAIRRGWRYLQHSQRPAGSWVPLWFGNQDDPAEENPVYGTAKVLLAYRDLGRLDRDPARRALQWLGAAQNHDGGWGSGGARSPLAAAQDPKTGPSSVEETALAIESLLPATGQASLQPTIDKGLRWLTEAVESQRYECPAPIGFYFAKLWYHESLYPLIFTVAALGQAVRTLLPPHRTDPMPAHLSPA